MDLGEIHWSRRTTEKKKLYTKCQGVYKFNVKIQNYLESKILSLNKLFFRKKFKCFHILAKAKENITKIYYRPVSPLKLFSVLNDNMESEYLFIFIYSSIFDYRMRLSVVLSLSLNLSMVDSFATLTIFTSHPHPPKKIKNRKHLSCLNISSLVINSFAVITASR